MTAPTYDIVTVGGRLAGADLWTRPPGDVEHETRFKDRVVSAKISGLRR